MRLCAAVPLLACLCAACADREGPPVEVADIRVFAPLPGSDAGVAYLTLSNHGSDAIVVSSARSPEFERVEIHETALKDGVASMRRVDTLTVAAGESAVFAPGGLHLMLVGPRAAAEPGQAVTLEIEHDHGLLVVSATLLDRQAELQ